MFQLRIYSWGILFLALFVLGCGGGGDGSSVGAIVCEGATGGTYSDAETGFQVSIPDGSLSSCQNASPAVSASTTTSDAYEANETPLSSSAYVIAMNTDDNDEALLNGNVTITMPFDSSLVPAADLDDVHVYVNVLDTDNNILIPVFGVLGDGVLTITATGLPANSKWVIVYNPYMQTISHDGSASPNLNPITSAPGVLTGNWAQNTWCVVYDAQDATLRQSIATALGTTPAALTNVIISNYVRDNVSKPSMIAGALYADGGFREPALRKYDYLGREARQEFCSSATESFYNIIISGASRFSPPAEGWLHNPFGTLYVGANRVGATSANVLGSTMASISHEMFHAVVAGYELTGKAFDGIDEGIAATMGMSIDQAYSGGLITENSADWSNIAMAYVRSSDATETYILSNQLNTRAISGNEEYANQDFYAYIANLSYTGKLSYVSTVLEDLYTNLTAEAVAIKYDTIWWMARYDRITNKMLYDSISDSVYTLLLDDLPTLYSTFILDRAYNHSATSVLRSTDSAAAGITPALFTASTLASETINPAQIKSSSFSKTGVFASVPPYASRLLTITSTETTTEDLEMPITLADAGGTNTIGSGGSSENIRAFVRGTTSAVNFSGGSATVDGWGKTNKTVYVIIANTTAETVNLTYAIGAAVGNTAPILSSLSCPSSVSSGSSGIVSMNYADADSDIRTLTEAWSLSNGQSNTNSADKSSEMSGTSGSFSAAITNNLSLTSSLTMILQYYVTDAQGNQSNTVSCTLSLTP